MANKSLWTYTCYSWGAYVILGFILIGLVAGVLGGMGLGGGTLLIPLMGLITDYDHLTLQLYNLLFFYPCGIVALIFHVKNGLVDYKVSKKIVFLGLIGAILGAYIATHIEVETLKKGFGVFMILIGLSQLFSKEKKEDSSKSSK